MDIGTEGEGIKVRGPVRVALPSAELGDRGQKLGQLIEAKNASFELANMYAAPQLGSNRFTEVYFRTESGNVYKLDRNGTLTNANETQRRGIRAETKLDKDQLGSQALTVGKPFVFEGGNTTRVTQIVSVTDRVFPPQELKGLTGGRSNNILSEFQTRIVRPTSHT